MRKHFLDLTAPVSTLMTTSVLCLRTECTLQEAVRFFLDNKFSGAPVINEHDKPVGVLTFKDIARYTEWHLEAEDAESEREDEERLNEPKEDEEFEDDTQNSTPEGCDHIDKLNSVNVG